MADKQAEEIDLNAEEEAALDAVWDQLARPPETDPPATPDPKSDPKSAEKDRQKV